MAGMCLTFYKMTLSKYLNISFIAMPVSSLKIWIFAEKFELNSLRFERDKRESSLKKNTLSNFSFLFSFSLNLNPKITLDHQAL